MKWILTILISALVAISYNVIADIIADKAVDEDSQSISTITEFQAIKAQLDRIENLLLQKN